VNEQGPLVIVAGRGPYSVISATDDANAPRFLWDRGAGGLAQGSIPLPRGSEIVSTPKTPEDELAQRFDAQPPRLVEQGVTQRFLMADEHTRRQHGEYFGRVTWFLHHDLFRPDHAPDLTAVRIRGLFDAHVAMNEIAAKEVVAAINRICDAHPDLEPWQIPVLVQDHHFDLVGDRLKAAWAAAENPRRELDAPASVLFLHTAIASRDSWSTFSALVPDVATKHAEALAATQVATHDHEWARRLTDILEMTLPPGTPVITPWAGPYPPSAQRAADIVDTPTFEADRASLRAITAGRRVVAAVARVDPPKNLPVLVEAFATMLEQHPELADEVVLVVQTGPGRNFPEYQSEIKSLERAVARANADAKERGALPPVKLETDGSAYRATALQLDADVIAFVSTSDGFGHVALEGAYAGSNAALVVSPNTGAARWIDEHCADAVTVVDPHSIQSIADGIHEALRLPAPERSRRAEALRLTAHELVDQAPTWANDQVRWAAAPAVVRALTAALTQTFTSPMRGIG